MKIYIQPNILKKKTTDQIENKNNIYIIKSNPIYLQKSLKQKYRYGNLER